MFSEKLSGVHQLKIISLNAHVLFFPHYHLHPFNILQILKVQIFIYQHIAYILPSTYSKYLNETEFYSFGSFQRLMIRTMSGT